MPIQSTCLGSIQSTCLASQTGGCLLSGVPHSYETLRQGVQWRLYASR